jgi:hypothetical protein
MFAFLKRAVSPAILNSGAPKKIDDCACSVAYQPQTNNGRERHPPKASRYGVIERLRYRVYVPRTIRREHGRLLLLNSERLPASGWA